MKDDAHLSDVTQIGEGRKTFSTKPGYNAWEFLKWFYEPEGYMDPPSNDQDEIIRERFTERFKDSESYRHGYNRGFTETVKSYWDEIKSEF